MALWIQYRQSRLKEKKYDKKVIIDLCQSLIVMTWIIYD